MHKTHGLQSQARWFTLEASFYSHTKLLGSSFLLTLDDVTLGVIKKGRNDASSVVAGLAEWADTVSVLF